MPNSMCGGVRGRKTKEGWKLLLRFTPTRLFFFFRILPPEVYRFELLLIKACRIYVKMVMFALDTIVRQIGELTYPSTSNIPI